MTDREDGWALVPHLKESTVHSLPEEVVEKLDVIFYGDVDRAVVEAMEQLGSSNG